MQLFGAESRSMAESLEDTDFDRLLAGAVGEAWARCLPVWRARGRIEDLPRHVTFPRYRVSSEKWLGRAFAETFLADWQFVAGRLSSPDPVEGVCAHDMLKLMIERWELVPLGVWAISAPLPEWVCRELAAVPSYASFRGHTLGELIRFEDEQGL
jgi:hypothetical protein